MLEGGGDEREAEEGDEEPGAVGLRRQLLPEPLGVPLAILRDQLLVRGACSDRLRVEEQPGPPHRRDRVLVRAAEPDGAVGDRARRRVRCGGDARPRRSRRSRPLPRDRSRARLPIIPAPRRRVFAARQPGGSGAGGAMRAVASSTAPRSRARAAPAAAAARRRAASAASAASAPPAAGAARSKSAHRAAAPTPSSPARAT